MKTFSMLFVLSLTLASCAQNKKAHHHSHETEMVKVQATDKVEEVIVTVEREVEAKTTTETSSSFECRAGNDVRVLEITPVDDSGCELKYTKNGETETIANANFNVSYCETVQQRIVKKLEAAGFSCQ